MTGVKPIGFSFLSRETTIENTPPKGEVFSMVNLAPSIYNEMVVEIVRWNGIVRYIGVRSNLLELA